MRKWTINFDKYVGLKSDFMGCSGKLPVYVAYKLRCLVGDNTEEKRGVLRVFRSKFDGCVE